MLPEAAAISRAKRIFDNTTTYREGHFYVELPWKWDNMELPKGSIAMAMKRLQCVEAKMRNDATYRQNYSQEIKNYVAKGFAHIATPAEQTENSPLSWYLPHSAVLNPNKPEKFRVVFDSSSKWHQVSPNDRLLSGPDINNPIVEILMKARIDNLPYQPTSKKCSLKSEFNLTIKSLNDFCSERIQKKNQPFTL